MLLRAERLPVGNGRVYRVAFTASDGRGGESAGSVAVCVPHHFGGWHPHHGGGADCVDDGQAYDSLAR